MSSYRSQLRAIVEVVECHSATRYWWFGDLSLEVADLVQPILAIRPDVARGFLVGNLSNRLYDDFYQRGGARPTRPPYAGSPRASNWEPLVTELSSANGGAGTLQAGWQVVAVDGEQLSIRRDGLTLRAHPEEIVCSGSGPPAPGDAVALRLPKELPAFSPGFYTALSNAPYQPAGRQVVRLYWNLQAWGAAGFARAVTARFNRAELPFRLKLVNHPDRYVRCDAAVLYLIKDDLPVAVPLLEQVYAEVWCDLKQPVPALTKRVSLGVGLAEDPPDGDSFGQQRCRLLADGIVRGWERGALTVDERLAIVVERFAEAGIDAERPYLNPGSVDDYDFAFQPPSDSTSLRPAGGKPTGSKDEFLRAAHTIGRELCREAFWHEGWCNWLGVEPRDPSAPAHHGMTYVSLGPELYGGSSGVALFLAELAVASGDEEARRTALGAIRQAVGRAETIKSPVQLGLYTGRPGLALTAARVGTLLDAEDMLDGARVLLDTLNADVAEHHEHDLLSGSAGAIVALLGLRQLLDDDTLRTPAIELGTRLVASAAPDGDGCSWPSRALHNVPNLTGLSHGAAGIALALLELWQATGDKRFRATAERAFAFERGWFSPEEGSWPDFRQVTWRDERPGGPFPYPSYWCHGAPGIALSRLRAWQLTGDPVYRDEAIVALNTTAKAVRAALHDGTANYSLCHGLAGNAEILMLGYRALGAAYERYAVLAHEVAAVGVQLYGAEDRDWSLGTHGGWTPSLMLGLAGIGRFYLRLAVPDAVPSVLLPTPTWWAAPTAASGIDASR